MARAADLLRTDQWNQLLAMAQEGGLEPSRLSREGREVRWANDAWETVPALTVVGSDAYFSIAEVWDAGEGTATWGVQYRPGDSYPVETVKGLSWSQVVKRAHAWSFLLSEAHDELDMWAQLEGSPTEGHAGDGPIPAEEQADWLRRLDELEARVATLEGLGEERQKQVLVEIAEVRSEVASRNRRSVERSVLGILFKLGLWGTDPSTLKEWLDLFLSRAEEVRKLLGSG